MSKKYSDLHTLLQEDSQAKRFFESLPDYVKDQMSPRAYNINSMESLRDYAENLVRGDH